MAFSKEEIRSATFICALRFDGYKFEADLRKKNPEVDGLYRLVDPVIESLQFHADENMNLAAFFGLQRYLGKWGGETLKEGSKEYIVFDFLFLHLYALEIPKRYQFKGYCSQWQEQYFDQREEIAEQVRKQLISGRGKSKLFPDNEMGMLRKTCPSAPACSCEGVPSFLIAL